MKTTIEIADPLLETAKSVAAREGTTLRALVEHGLRTVLKERESDRPFKLRDASVTGQGLQPEAKGMGWEGIRELAYGEQER